MKLDFAKINKSLIEEFVRLNEYENDYSFWKYLTRNNLANYYISQSGIGDNEYANKIRIKANEYRNIYHNTLLGMSSALNKNSIDFSLFKTDRMFGEVADGDVDIFVRKKDFEKTISSLSHHGFKYADDGKLKAIFTKNGLMKIEPRVNITSYERILLKEAVIWEFMEQFELNGMHLNKTRKELDVFALLLNALYGPKYIRLYELKTLRMCDSSVLTKITSDSAISHDFSRVLNELRNLDLTYSKFPFFWSNTFYMRRYFESIVNCPDYKMPTKIRQLAFFYFMKLEYTYLDKLHFEHPWL